MMPIATAILTLIAWKIFGGYYVVKEPVFYKMKVLQTEVPHIDYGLPLQNFVTRFDDWTGLF